MQLAVERLGVLGVVGTRAAFFRQRPHLVPDALQEALHGSAALVVPLQVLVGRGHEQDVGARRVDAVVGDDVFGRDDVALGLGHGLAVLVFDHALAQQVRERLVEVDHAEVAGDLGPETTVEQVQNRVLDAADVLVDRHVVVDLGAVKRRGVVVRVGVAHVVPRGARERVHRVGLAVRGLAALGAGALIELLAVLERLARGDVDVHGQRDGEVFLVDRDDAAVVAVHHGDGVAPVALAADQPVAQAEVDRALAASVLFEPGNHGGGAFGTLAALHAGELAGLHHDAGLGVCLVPVDHAHDALFLVFQLLVERVVLLDDDGRDVQAVLLGELEVALVARGDGHDSTGAVVGQDVVCDPDRDLHPIDWVDDVAAGKGSVLLVVAHRALDGGRLLGDADDLVARFLVGGARDQALDQLVLGRKQEERAAEQRVGAGREHGDLGIGGLTLLVAQREVDVRALGTADPVGLHLLDALGPAVELVEVVEELLGVVGYLEVPLVELLALDDAVAAPARALLDLLVGEHGLAARAPVDRVALAVGEALLVHLEEEPLAPTVVVLLAGDDGAVPIVGKAHALEAGLLGLDVLERPLGGLRIVLDGGVLCRQAEGVPPDGMQDVVAVHMQVARVHIADRVVADMPHVDVARRVREHLEDVLRGPRARGRNFEQRVLLPLFLPFWLYCVRIVCLGHCSYLREISAFWPVVWAA